jgi:hypothetical protein
MAVCYSAPRLFELLGGDSWMVYRFLTQYHPEVEGDATIGVAAWPG